MSRDDFSETDKIILAKRAGYKCSFPGCGQETVGPSRESDNSVSSIGVACHITAASPGRGARRYASGISKKHRASTFENGIWMCQTHSKLIDTDEKRFTTEKLFAWKRIAEKRAELSSSELSSSDFEIPNDEISLNSINSIEIEKASNFIVDSAISVIWGQGMALSVRDLIIELARNSLTHGNAKYVKVLSNKNVIKIMDDGTIFSIENLIASPNGQGGANTVKYILENYGASIILQHFYLTKENEYRIVILKNPQPQNLINSLVPCVKAITRDDIRDINFFEVKSCEKINIVIGDLMSPSDVYQLFRKLKSQDIDAKKVVIHFFNSSPVVVAMAKEICPDFHCKYYTKS